MTKAQILALRDDAEENDNQGLIKLCNSALKGDAYAVDACTFSMNTNSLYNSDLTVGIWVS